MSTTAGTRAVPRQLLAETLKVPEGRAFVLERICTPELLGPALVDPIRRPALMLTPGRQIVDGGIVMYGA